MNKRHILVIEDDAQIRALLVKELEASGYRVTALADGRNIEQTLDDNDVDLAILDLVLPHITGLDLLKRLRERSDISIIILSGLGEMADRVVGLELGADDYIAKPFAAREVVARVRSLFRRVDRFVETVSPGAPQDIAQHDRYIFSGWILDVRTRSLHDPDGQFIPLTSGEFFVLEILVGHANVPVPRKSLLQVASADGSAADERSIDVCIGRLRRKLRDNGRSPQLIRTIRGAGYQFAAHVSRDSSPTEY